MVRKSNAHPKKSESKECAVWDRLEAMSYEIIPLAEEREHVEEEEARQRGDIVFGMAIKVSQVKEYEKDTGEKGK